MTPQPYVYNTVDRKGKDKQVEVHLDERDPVYVKLRGLELHHVTARLQADSQGLRASNTEAAKKVCMCVCARVCVSVMLPYCHCDCLVIEFSHANV